MAERIRRHEDYSRQERGRLRRLARREVPEVETLAPADPPRQKYFVVEMGTDDAINWGPVETAAAALMRRRCAKDLGIRKPPLELLIRVSPAQAGDLVRRDLMEPMNLRRVDTDAVGLASRRKIVVCIDRRPWQVAGTTAHETRHVAQSEAVFSDREAAEADAREYQVDAMRRFWPAVEEKLPNDCSQPTEIPCQA